MLLNKESKRETPSVITFTSKQRMMGTDAGGNASRQFTRAHSCSLFVFYVQCVLDACAFAAQWEACLPTRATL